MTITHGLVTMFLKVVLILICGAHAKDYNCLTNAYTEKQFKKQPSGTQKHLLCEPAQAKNAPKFTYHALNS